MLLLQSSSTLHTDLRDGKKTVRHPGNATRRAELLVEVLTTVSSSVSSNASKKREFSSLRPKRFSARMSMAASASTLQIVETMCSSAWQKVASLCCVFGHVLFVL